MKIVTQIGAAIATAASALAASNAFPAYSQIFAGVAAILTAALHLRQH